MTIETPPPDCFGFDGGMDDSGHAPYIEKLLREALTEVVLLYAKREGVAFELADRVRLEFLRFLSLARFDDGLLLPPAPVERFWKLFITEMPARYQELSQTHFFGSTPPYPVPQGNRPHLLEHTKKAIRKYYKQYDTDIWGTTDETE